ncbi:MAG: extracellular solute-binding protein [Lachnospiraceae bacterium]|nr:extracellular solute-binding protein [Lachnospiraceae bacterium]
MATLKDIAQRVGCSIATVSYCINNTKPIKAATREKIMRAIDELNYIPNSSARSLRSKTTNEVGVILPDIDDHCHSEILKGIIASSEAANFSPNIAFSYNTPKLECKIIDEFIGKNIAGLIVATCQPQNHDYFHNTLISHNIPTVFLERFPENIDANFLAFDNYNSVNYLTRKLIERGYRNIFLMTGYSKFFSESECIRGFTDAHDDMGITFSPYQMMEADMTKEAAFRQAMFRIVGNPPEAIIVSSELLSKGILEAFDLCDIHVPKNTCVLTLGEECWNQSNYATNLIHTARTAYTLGKHSIKVLENNMDSPIFFEKEFMLFKDNIVGSHLKLPPVPQPFPPRPEPRRILRILTPSLPTLLALDAVSAEFEKEHDIKFEFDLVDYRTLIKTILADSQKSSSQYDIYLFDVSWLTYLANMDVFADLTQLIQSNETFQKRLIKKNLENCCYEGHYYGFPIIGGSHLLFYRKDLFDNPMIQKQFEAQYNAPLRPPMNWTEFNAIAKFFTKEYNPYSPTAYGTSVIGSINEEFSLEILIRLWSFGGSLYDSKGKICLQTPQNIKAFQSLLESCNYAEKNIFDDSIDQSFHAFGAGRTAMLLSFTEYASQINDFIRGDIVTKVDYSMLPGKTPANVGWNMGVSKTTRHTKLITEYFEWICDKRTSYYMTALNGQSVVTYPYQNHEILKLNPWMELNAECLSKAQSRIYPYQSKSRLVPPFEVETVLYDMFKKMYKREMSILDALHDAQKILEKKFSS